MGWARRAQVARGTWGAQAFSWLSCSAWDASQQPAWLTSEVFAQQIQPVLASIPTSAIRTRIGVSRWYAGRIRQGLPPASEALGGARATGRDGLQAMTGGI